MLLGIWCSVSPATTSAKVGFDLQAGAGQSEFLTVYGGLEIGIALILLIGVFKKSFMQHAVITSVVLHGSLVVFRTISFFRFSDVDPFIYRLAAGEWIIFLAGAVILKLAKNRP